MRSPPRIWPCGVGRVGARGKRVRSARVSLARMHPRQKTRAGRDWGSGDAARRILGAMRADEPVFSHREVRKKFGGTRDGARLTTAPPASSASTPCYTCTARGHSDVVAHFDNHGCRVARDSTDGLEELTTVTTLRPRKKDSRQFVVRSGSALPITVCRFGA